MPNRVDELCSIYREQKDLIELMEGAGDLGPQYAQTVVYINHVRKELKVLLEEAVDRKDENEYDFIKSTLEYKKK